MKPQNLLVFRDQKVKVGDIGVSIKLDPSISSDEKAYFLKGLTKNFSHPDTLSIFMKHELISDSELLKADRFAV